MREALAANSRALGFLASVIKSGEPWTESCQAEYDGARNKARSALARITVEDASDE